MTWIDHWKALSARIDGIIRAGEFLVAALRVNSADHFDVYRKSFFPELESISLEIDNFGKVYSNDLPPEASLALKKYIGIQQNITQQCKGRNPKASVDIQALAPLASFRSQFEYYIRDSEIEGRSLSELAFEHLRRQLVVDEDIRLKWLDAFNRHETHCEKLGAVHLLSHGIWAFKAATQGGGATDLVFGDLVTQHTEAIKRTARALVLTEWKLVKQSDELLTKAKEAREQIIIYSGGVLGNIELKRTRYIVLVCKSDLIPPDDELIGPVTYRHIVLPMNSESPSKTARKRSRG